MKFKKGDLVTFSDDCPKDLRKPFSKGPRKITEIESGWSYPYKVGTSEFKANELKLVKKTK